MDVIYKEPVGTSCMNLELFLGKEFQYSAVVLDLDGVITDTRHLHIQAWKSTFDEYLVTLQENNRVDPRLRPFDPLADYTNHVDGKPRQDGIRSFLASRGISLGEGRTNDTKETNTIHELGVKKNIYYLELLEQEGPHVFHDALEVLKIWRKQGIPLAVVSSSQNCDRVLKKAGIEGYFHTRVDGIVGKKLGLRGKPEPDYFLEAAKQLGVEPYRTILVEDAVAGVEAGQRGSFGAVIGMDRSGENARALLMHGAEHVVSSLEELTDDLTWHVIQDGFEASREREMEALFAIGNGYLGIRATADFTVPAAQPDLFIAGIYDRKSSILPYSEVEFLSQGNRESLETEIVPFPSPLRYQLRIAGTLLTSRSTKMNTHTRKLNMRRGIYTEEHSFEDSSGRKTRIQSLRCASLSNRHLLLQRIRIYSENYSAPIELDLSSGFQEYKSLYPHIDLTRHDVKSFPAETLVYHTQGSELDCAIVSSISSGDKEIDFTLIPLDVNPGGMVEIYRITCVYTSRDARDPLSEAQKHVLSTMKTPFYKLLVSHVREWSDFWFRADLDFTHTPELSQALRFNLYHLRIAADHEPRVSIPAKALTGRAYEGHIFWDTEIFMFPFFLYTEPEIAKSLLLYRYHTLEGARKRAQGLGYEGACYAWESTISGEDVTPRSIVVSGKNGEIPIFTGIQQIHVTADVAYAFWKYWDATLDFRFLCDYGGEIFVETARFWASRVALKGETYHILDVVGPDEYHYNIHNNTYTNWMARFNLDRAVWVYSYLNSEHPGEFRRFTSRLHIGREEFLQWKAIASRMFVAAPDERGIIEQFSGFHALLDVSIQKHEKNRAPINRLFNWKEINRTKLIKQADVLMIPFLFPDQLPSAVIKANYDFYEPITDHGSSLSPCVHAAIAARIGRLEQAKTYWEKSLYFDLNNTMSNTALGIHVAAMGGTWQALVFHILGISLNSEGIQVRNKLDEASLFQFGDITLKLIYRGKPYPFQMQMQRKTRSVA